MCIGGEFWHLGAQDGMFWLFANVCGALGVNADNPWLLRKAGAPMARFGRELGALRPGRCDEWDMGLDMMH